MNPYRLPVRILVASTLLAVASSAALAQNMAVVNGKPIPKSRLDATLAQFKEEAARKQQPLPPDLEKQIRAHLIKEAVIVQQAEQHRLHLTPEYANKMSSARGSILTAMLFEQYKKDHPVNDEAAKAEYDRVVASMAEAVDALEYDASHILVRTPADVRMIQSELKAGRSFAWLARKHSQDTGSAKQGGKLGWAQADNYVPEFAAALKKLEKGQTTATAVKTQFGYHIIRLEDTRKARVPAFDVVKEQIKQQLQSGQAAAFEKYLNELEKKARIR